MQKGLIVFLNEYLKVIVAALTIANRPNPRESAGTDRKGSCILKEKERP